MGDQTESNVGRGVSRRDMIKRAAAAGAVAWSAPVIVDSLTAPAGALTPPPCPPEGVWYVALHSPTPGGGLQERPGSSWSSSYSSASYYPAYPGSTCQVVSPGGTCAPINGGLRTTAAAIQLNTTGINISHNVTNQARGPVTLSLAQSSCCKITRVVAQVHRYGTPEGGTSSGDCPSDYCQVAASGNTYLPLTGTLPGKNVTLSPSQSNGLCSPSPGIHWGSPNNDTPCNTGGGNGYTNGQPFGYLMIELQCHPSFVGQP